MRNLKGTPVSGGYAAGKALVRLLGFHDEPIPENGGDPETEKQRFSKALEEAVCQIQKICDEMSASCGEQVAEIFSAHLDMIQDPEFVQGVKTELEEQCCCCECAVKTVRARLMELFLCMENDYMKERALDIQDISNRILRLLGQGKEDTDSLKLADEVILVADEISPSQLAEMDPTKIRGIINESGGTTSHTAIIARILNIPYIICPGAANVITTGQDVDMDGETGMIELND